MKKTIHQSANLTSTLFIFLSAFALMAGCLAEEGEEAVDDESLFAAGITKPAQCLLSESAKAVVGQIGWQSISDAVFMLTTPQVFNLAEGEPTPLWALELGFTAFLPGFPEAGIGATAVYPANICASKPKASYSCKPIQAQKGVPDPKRNWCLQLACRGPQKFDLSTYYTMTPHTAPTVRHAFDYASTKPEGAAYASRNPLTTWSIDMSTASITRMNANFTQKIALTPRGEKAVLALDHRGTISGKYHRASEAGVADVQIQFPSLITKKPVTANLHATLPDAQTVPPGEHPEPLFEGSIQVGNATVATLNAGEWMWQACVK